MSVITSGLVVLVVLVTLTYAQQDTDRAGYPAAMDSTYNDGNMMGSDYPSQASGEFD